MESEESSWQWLSNTESRSKNLPLLNLKYITGNGKAEKILVQKTIMKLYKLQELPEYNDAADALGLAYLATRIK